MTPIRRLLLVLVLFASVAACSSATGGPGSPSPATPAATAPAPTVPATDAPSPDGSMAPSAEPTVDASTGTAVVLDQAWATAELVDVASGEAFRIADLAGRTVILETMAIWCTKCFAQQQHVYEALTEVGAKKVEYLLIDVDPSESAEALAAYRDQHGFTGRYVVADQELARALAADFGDQVLNPPATPMIVIGTDGRVTLTPYGQAKSPDEVVALSREHGA